MKNAKLIRTTSRDISFPARSRVPNPENGKIIYLLGYP